MKMLSTVALIIAGGLSASAQSYTMPWAKIAGGGAMHSTGGVYKVSGTIGQPDAGRAQSSSYTLASGFWGVIPVQTAGAPTLFIESLGNGSVKLTWQPTTPGFVVQESTALHPVSAWTNAPANYTNGAVIPAAQATRYFRLIKQ